MIRVRFAGVTVMVVSWVVVGFAQQSDSLRRLHDISKKSHPSEQEYDEAREILDTIAQQARAGDPEVMASLMAIVTDKKRSALVSLPALRVLCQKADRIWATRLVEAMRGNLATLAEVSVKPNDIVHGRLAAFLDCFVEDCAVQLLPKLSDPRPILEVLLGCGVLREVWLRPAVQQKARRLIATVNVNLAIRKEYALKLIKAMPSYPFPDGFEKLFTQEDLGALRSLVQAPNNRPATFCYGAAGLLAHLGDEGALPALREFLEREAKGKPTREGMIRYYIWQIESQHPPSKLLDYIASDEDVVLSGRPWAVRRAVELEVPKDRIRQAILDRAEHVEPDKKGFREQELASLKRLGVELGILGEEDLPGVKARVPGVQVTP